MKRTILIALILSLFSFCAQAQTIVPAKDALKHLGEKVTICDKVYSENLKALAITLYLGGDPPNQLLTIVIKPNMKTKIKGYENNAHFEGHYIGKEVCITGVITKDKDGKAVIRVYDPKQIKPFMIDSMPEQKSSLH